MVLIAGCLEFDTDTGILLSYFVMDYKVKVTSQAEQEAEDLEHMRSLTPEERLDLLEIMRREAGKFAYEYPS